jgi:hypothetical protein
MVEAGAQQVSEAGSSGRHRIRPRVLQEDRRGIRELVKLAGKPKREFTRRLDQELYARSKRQFRARADRRAEHREVPKLESYARCAR